MLLVAWLLNDNENYWIPLVLLEYVLTADTAAPRREATRGFVMSWDPCPWLKKMNFELWTLNFEHWTLDIEFVNGPTGGRLREREPTRDNVWEPCVQGDRSHQKPHARRVFVLHNMQTPLDFNSVDFLGMLEVLGLQLIFMHRGNWRDFLWSYYCAFVSWWYCDGRTLIVWCVDCMSTVVLATAHVVFETHQGKCHSTLGMRYGFLPYRRGVFHFRLVMLMFCGN